MTRSKLPPGEYPFIDETVPLSEMTMVEAPSDLEDLFKNRTRPRRSG